MFLYTTRPCNPMSISASAENKLFLMVPLLLTLVAIFRYKIDIMSKELMRILLVLTAWNIIMYFTQWLMPSPYLYAIVICAFTIYRCFKDDFFDRFINVSLKLSLVALVGWALVLINHDAIYQIAMNVGQPGYGISHSLYIFSIPETLNGGIVWRNCGYCWEPGRYACFLCIAIFFFIYKYGLLWRDKRFLVLLIALISTQSTTGYILFFVILALIQLKGLKFNPFYMIPIVVLFYFVLSLPFMQQKIIELSDVSDTETSVYNYMTYQNDDEYIVPQRFQAMLFQLENFRNMHFLTGDGIQTNFYLNRVMGIRVNLAEGILGILIRYGLIIGLFMYTLLYKSSILISQKLSGSKSIAFLLVFIVANFSYYLWEDPMIMTIVFLPIFKGDGLFVKHKVPLYE